MKKVLILLLALILVFALAACGEEKEADVIAGSDAKDTVIETPTAPPQQPIINEVTTTQTPEYTNVEVLPTTAPAVNTNPGAVSVTPAPATNNTGIGTGTGTAVSVPIPTKDPSTTETQTGTTETGETTAKYEITFADDSGEMYYPTATQEEKNNGKAAYTNVLHANLRVGPGTQYKIYESLRKYADLKVISVEGNWVKVWYDGQILGYIYKDYISYGTPPASNVAPDPGAGGSAEVIITP